jgi:hypothetical protein
MLTQSLPEARWKARPTGRIQAVLGIRPQGAWNGGHMVELMIEHWSNLDGSSHYLWSIWRDGKRLEMSGRIASAEKAEAEGRAWCEKALARSPDRITRL